MSDGRNKVRSFMGRFCIDDLTLGIIAGAFAVLGLLFRWGFALNVAAFFSIAALVFGIIDGKVVDRVQDIISMIRIKRE